VDGSCRAQHRQLSRLQRRVWVQCGATPIREVLDGPQIPSISCGRASTCGIRLLPAACLCAPLSACSWQPMFATGPVQFPRRGQRIESSVHETAVVVRRLFRPGEGPAWDSHSSIINSRGVRRARRTHNVMLPLGRRKAPVRPGTAVKMRNYSRDLSHLSGNSVIAGGDGGGEFRPSSSDP
jgi:hypothetical protein